MTPLYPRPRPSARTNARLVSPEERARSFLRDKIAKAAFNGPFAEYVELTPALARVLLENNPNNRRINQTAVAEWAKALSRGEWQVNGEPIIVANTGQLNDGQHRCAAVVETETTITVLMSFGTTRSSRDTIDLGVKRSAAAVFAMEGIANNTVLPAAMKILLNLEAGRPIDSHRSIAEIKTAVLTTAGFSDSLPIGAKIGRSFRISKALMTALHFYFAHFDRKHTEAFMGTLSSGIGLPSEKHPIARLRTRLMRNMAEKAKLPNREIAVLITKAWAATRPGNGRDISTRIVQVNSTTKAR